MPAISDTSRTCFDCGTTIADSAAARGRRAQRCDTCRKERDRARERERYRQQREHLLEQRHERYRNAVDRERQRSKAYYEENREQVRARQAARPTSYRPRPPKLCRRCGLYKAPTAKHWYCVECSMAVRAEKLKTSRAKLAALFANPAPRRKTGARGYGTEHRRLRDQWRRQVEAGLVVCARCGRPIQPGTPWDLGHDDRDRSRYNGPEHARCNRRAGAVAGMVEINRRRTHSSRARRAERSVQARSRSSRVW